MKELIDSNNLPRHIAVIMDGNGRWAKKQGAARIFGHKNAVKSVKEVVEGCAELGIEYLTLYAFSTENWARPKDEVSSLMQLLVSTIRKQVKDLKKNNIQLKAIGNLESLPKICQRELQEAIEVTSVNSGLTVVLALSYGSREEILNATKRMMQDAKDGLIEPEDVDDALFSKYLHTNNMPDPELLIRTSGEMRISNFLLYQIAYTELYITDEFWPDFRKESLHKAIIDYQKRERRFGKISEQVKTAVN